MSLEALQCKECAKRYAPEARYVCEDCFGPLEVVYDFSQARPAELRRRIEQGPQSIWRYVDFCPSQSRPTPRLRPV